MKNNWIIISAFIIPFVSVSKAEVLIDDDFSSASTSSYLNATSGGTWSKVSAYGSTYNVSGANVESPFSTSATARCAALSDTSSTGGIGMGAQASFATQTANLHVSFDYYIDSQGLANAAEGVAAFSPTVIISSSSGTGGLFLMLSNYSSNDSKYYLTNQRDSGSSIITEVTLQTWYHVDLTANVATDKYTISVKPFDGTETNTSISYSFRNPLTDFGSLTFEENNGNTAKGAYYIDNMFIETVPEPAALSLFAIGALALLKHR